MVRPFDLNHFLWEPNQQLFSLTLKLRQAQFYAQDLGAPHLGHAACASAGVVRGVVVAACMNIYT